MDIHEYQAKEILANFGVATPHGAVAYSPDQAVYCATELGGWHWAVKAQIHSGGRGKAGGVKLCKTYNEVRAAAAELLGKTLVTNQTGPEGKIVQRVYIEVAEPFEREIYLGFVLDRKVERVRVIASRFGGMDIEEIAKDHPEEILQVVVEPAVGLQPFEARELAFGLGLNIKQVSRAVASILGCYRAFRDLDATMVEINPLVVTKDDRVLALDAKMSFDDNALFRRGTVADMRDHSQEDPREVQAAEHNLNYVGLDGNIGCIVNGAGLAMATMDMIKHAGGNPANFLDRRRRRLAGTRCRGVSFGVVRPQRQGDSGQRVRRNQPLRLGGRRHRQGLPRIERRCPAWWSVSREPMSRPGATSSGKAACRSSPPIPSPMPPRRRSTRPGARRNGAPARPNFAMGGTRQRC